MSRIRYRRPLIALIALVVAVAIGYAVDALNGSGSGNRPAPSPSVTTAPMSPQSGISSSANP